MMNEPNTTSNIQEEDFNGDDQANVKRNRFSAYRSEIFNKAALILAERKALRNSWKWIMINTFLSVLFYIGILEKWLEHYGFQKNVFAVNIDYVLSLIFLWNSLVNFIFYLSTSFKNDPLMVTNKQKQLLQIEDKDKAFKVLECRQAERTAPKSSRHIVTWPKRRQSSTSNVGLANDSSFERGISPCTALPWQDTTHSPTNQAFNRSYESPTSSFATMKSNTSASSLTAFQKSPGRSPAHDDDHIHNSEALNRYLKNEEERDSNARVALDASHTAAGNSFWTFGHSALDFLPTFGMYQLATRSPQSQNHVMDDLTSSFDYDKILNLLNVGKADIERWTENLRKWIAETIVEKLVAEIGTVNNVLVQNGCSEYTIGSVSLSVLRHVAITKSQLVPTLHSVIPYLDVCSNQEYLVKRLEDLATGGCLRLYKWDSGGTYKGKRWDQELPTDAHIISHLFCTYMDIHLPSNPRYQHGFSELHFLKPPNKPSDRKCDICILQTRSQPPHFKVIDSNDVHDTPPGRHNLFVTISIFLFLIKTKKHGMLERVNLGASGLNILWILNKR